VGCEYHSEPVGQRTKFYNNESISLLPGSVVQPVEEIIVGYPGLSHQMYESSAIMGECA
jgi:hypothetical protein